MRCRIEGEAVALRWGTTTAEARGVTEPIYSWNHGIYARSLGQIHLRLSTRAFRKGTKLRSVYDKSHTTCASRTDPSSRLRDFTFTSNLLHRSLFDIRNIPMPAVAGFPLDRFCLSNKVLTLIRLGSPGRL